MGFSFDCCRRAAAGELNSGGGVEANVKDCRSVKLRT